MIAIPDLPIRDYPLLAKFQQLKSIQFYKEGRSGATDAKLEALAAVRLPELREIELIAARSVTDKGIQALSKIISLKSLSLEGTSITDRACEIIASKMHLGGINVANCSNITSYGLLSLATSDSLKEISFSAGQLTQADIVRLISAFKRITWCEIVDPLERFDKEALLKLGNEKGIQIVLKKTGALQDLSGVP
jgi:hypothetical protein